MSGEQQSFLDEFFDRTLFPIVTPLAIDPGPSISLPGESLALFSRLFANQ
jgi:polyphosphate kinase